jgi:hypothetical protein
MSKMARDKGKRGERMWRDRLRAHGFIAERAGYKQAHLGSGGADVEDNSGYWWEVKFVEKLNVRQAYEQASAACPIVTTPVVAHKTSSKPFLITMADEDFLNIISELHRAREKLSQLDQRLKELADATA